jgi:hypothetical protein
MVPNSSNPFISSKVASLHTPAQPTSTNKDSEISNSISAFLLQPQSDTENNDGSTQRTRNSSVVLASVGMELNSGKDSLSAIRQQLQKSTVPDFLLHLPTMLVEFYFNYVCGIFSSFDGTFNPFRSTVGKLWDGSAPIYYAIQSMAAAYLANHFPRMSLIGVQMQRETYRYLYQAQKGANNSENIDRILLTVLLVGQTTAWHNPKDLGLVHLKTAKQLNQRRIQQQISQRAGIIDSSMERQNAFFEQCILYWDMLVGFVEDRVDECGLNEFGRVNPITLHTAGVSGSSDDKDNIFPHPWTGVAPKVQRLFVQVGCLIRNYRKTIAQSKTSSSLLSECGLDNQNPQHYIVTTEAILKAQSLEEDLLAFESPSVSSLVDTGDENTPVQQYLDLAEAYRCAALLQIYRIFPSVLLRRLPLTNDTFASSFNTPAKQMLSFLPISLPQPPDEFLVSLAIHTISLLEKLPPNSGTRCLQPIVIITAASELCFTSDLTSDLGSPLIPANLLFNGLTTREVDTAYARRFTVTRLQDFQLSLPAKPIVKALQLVQETWKRADMGLDVYWMDVMDEMDWASIFG